MENKKTTKMMIHEGLDWWIYKIKEWGKEKGIIHRLNILKQVEKLKEEVKELDNAETRDKCIDELGDVFVVAIMIASCLELEVEEILEKVYKKIEKRKRKNEKNKL